MTDPAPRPDKAFARGLPVRRFSTAGVAPRQRHQAWVSQGFPSIARRVEAVAAPGFFAEAETIGVGPIQLIYGHYGEQTVRRTPERRRAVPSDVLTVALVVSGGIEGDWAQLKPGELALGDMALDHGHRSLAGELITFSVPRTLAHDHGLDARVLHGSRVGAEQAALLGAHLRQIRRHAAQVASDQGPRLARTVLDLLGVAVAGTGRDVGAPAGAATATKLRAEAMIAAGAADPRLDAEELGRRLGVSRATLYRLFAGEGGVQRRIRRERLLAARRALDAGGASVAAVAERFGFGDAGHFSRAFSAAFGLSPSDHRAAALKRHEDD